MDNKESSPVKKSPSKIKKQYPLLKKEGLFNDVDIYEPNRADRAYSVDGGISHKPMTAVTNMSVNPSQSSTMYEQKWSNIDNNNDLITTFKTIYVHKENFETNYKTNKLKILDNFSKQYNDLKKNKNSLKPGLIRAASQPYVRTSRPNEEKFRKTMVKLKSRAEQIEKLDKFVTDFSKQNSNQILQTL